MADTDLQVKAREIADGLHCAKRCKCGGWQRVDWSPGRAELLPYCGACGVQMGPVIDVWPGGSTTAVLTEGEVGHG